MLSIRSIRSFLLLLGAATLGLVILGGFVRATGAGLSCPDWPLCFGMYLPELREGVTQEYIHRVLAGGVSLCTLFLFAVSIRYRRMYPSFVWLMTILSGILIAQVVLGGLTVILKLNPFIVTAHLLFGTIFFQLVVSVAVHRPRPEISADALRVRPWVLAALLLVLFQIVLGGFVGASGASMACIDFPLCQDGALLPDDARGPQIVHMLHRGVAVGILLLLCYLALRIRRLPRQGGPGVGHLFGMIFLTLLQIVLGTLNVLLVIPIPIALAHLLVAELLLFGMLVLYLRLVPGFDVFAETGLGMGTRANAGAEAAGELGRHRGKRRVA